MRIQHNIMAMNAYRNYNTNNSALSKNLEKLSSGYAINRAGDDAAGLAISEKMRAQITGLDTAQKNAKDGISLVQTAEGALTEVHDMLNRMVELATQSANGTYENETDRAQLQKEVVQLQDEIDRIADSANFNGINLLNGDLSASVTNGGGMSDITVNVVQEQISGTTGTKGRFQLDFNNVVVDSSTTAAQTVTVNIGTTSFAVSVSATGTVTAQSFVDAITGAGSTTVIGGVTFTVTDKGSGVLEFEMAETPTSGDSLDTAFDVSIQVGTDASYNEGLKATTTITSAVAKEDGKVATGKFSLSGYLEDGKMITIGDQTFTFAIGADSKYKDANNVIDLSTYETTDAGLADAAAQALAKAANGKVDNVIIGYNGNDVTITVDKDADKAFIEKYNLEENDATAWQGFVQGGEASTTTTSGGLELQIGDTSDSFNQLRVSIQDMHSSTLGIDAIDIGDQDGAQAAIKVIKDAINTVSDVRGTLGATQNRLDHTINNLSVMEENIQDAESTIRDTDVAEEMMAYTKNNILIQSAQAMLAQANQVPQGVLQLLG